MSVSSIGTTAPIALDARFIHEGGIARYISALVSALMTQEARQPVRVYVPSPEYARQLGLPQPGWEPVVLPTRTYHPGEQWVLCRQLRRDAPTLLHATNHWVVPLLPTARLVVTVHDVLFQVRPDFLAWKVRAYAWLMTRLALRRAQRIITVSEFTRSEVIRFWPEVASKTVAVPSGVEERFQPVRDPATLAGLRARYELPPRFFLYVGTTKPHKNLVGLIGAYALLPDALRAAYPLVLLARPNPRHPEVPARIDAHGLTGQVLWRHGIPNEDMPGLYSLATAVVTPSLYEGFGFPLLEAMACGTPTLAARAASLPEVGGDATLYADPTKPGEMADGLRRLVEDPELRHDLRRRGLNRAKGFTWERTAATVRAIYDEVLSQTPR